jgi:hypothetical protein
MNNNTINGINNNDIDLFITTYEKELNNGIIPHPKIGLWIQYLKALKFYNVNNIEKDSFFDKRYSITKNDIKEINIFMNRIKKGKQLYKNDNYSISGNGSNLGCGIRGNGGGNSFVNYNYVDDMDDGDGEDTNKNNFELLSQVEDALHEYNEKMMKNKNKNININRSRNELKIRENPMNVCPDNYKYGVKDFAEGPVNNANISNAINQLENTEKLINYNYTNKFDNEFKRSIPNIANNKRHQEHNTQYNLINDNRINNNESNVRGMDVGVNGGAGGTGYIADRYKQDALYTNNSRFNQDRDIKLNLITRETSQKNKQPFENQFQYLDCNYNKIPNKSLIGESSRMDNRTYIH